jgi:hypothetical protein
VADPKTHAAIRKHLQTARAAHKQVGDSMDKIEQILSAMKGQPPAQQPAAPGLPSNGISPMGGLASQ